MPKEGMLKVVPTLLLDLKVIVIGFYMTAAGVLHYEYLIKSSIF